MNELEEPMIFVKIRSHIEAHRDDPEKLLASLKRCLRRIGYPVDRMKSLEYAVDQLIENKRVRIARQLIASESNPIVRSRACVLVATKRPSARAIGVAREVLSAGLEMDDEEAFLDIGDGFLALYVESGDQGDLDMARTMASRLFLMKHRESAQGLFLDIADMTMEWEDIDQLRRVSKSIKAKKARQDFFLDVIKVFQDSEGTTNTGRLLKGFVQALPGQLQGEFIELLPENLLRLISGGRSIRQH